MLPTEPVSPLFAQLYDTKIRMLRENLGRLDLLLSRHNFFDCQTILQLQHPQTHRKALLLQADMDVDADGSDGDRMTSRNRRADEFQTVYQLSMAEENGAAKSVSCRYPGVS